MPLCSEMGTSPMDYNSHHSLHYDTHIPIHHCTNHTAVTNHSLTLIVSPHLHLIHTHISSTLPCTHHKVLFSPVWHFRVFPLSVFLCFDPACLLISSLSAGCPDLCIAPVADSALPSLHLLLSMNLACLTSSCLSIKLQLDLTTLPLHYRRLRHLRSSGFISATQPNHGLHRPTPTSSPGRPVYWGVCTPVLWAVLSGTAVRQIFVPRLVSFRAQWTHQIPV